MGKFLGWLGGILAVVIGGWTVWYLTKPPSTTTVQGMVIDGSLNAPLSNAMVSVEVTATPSNGPFHDVTDVNGSYRLDFTGLSKSSRLIIRVQARGFQEPKPASFATISVDNRQDFVLMPVVAANPPAVGNPAIGKLAVARPPAYIQKAINQAVRVQLHQKP